MRTFRPPHGDSNSKEGGKGGCFLNEIADSLGAVLIRLPFNPFGSIKEMHR
jgi:hypothetical protein